MAHLHDTAGTEPKQDAAAGRGARVRESCLRYLDEGMTVITYSVRRKFSTKPNWPVTARLTREQAERLNDRDADKKNVGILTGMPSGGLFDVDLDVPQAVAAAKVFLPPTDRMHGRPSNPRSHYWFRSPDTPDHETFAWQFADDGKQTKYVELRGGNDASASQTMIPPSRHPNGEELIWDADGEPATLPYAELHRCGVQVALAALFARHWPAEGARNDGALALSGGLVRETDWNDEEVDAFVTTVAHIAGDEEYAQRANAERTRQRLHEEQPTTGWTKLAELLPTGERVVAKAREWLETIATTPDHPGAEAGTTADETDTRTGKDGHSRRPSPADDAERELAGVLAALLGPRSRTHQQSGDARGNTTGEAHADESAPASGLHCLEPCTELFHTQD
ncbi:MAG TPA: bifunctional DNA primase/polymerase, partial [Ktedonobacterales bacterium]